MMSFIETTRNRLARRAAYRSTLQTLRNLPLVVRLDLDIAGIEDKVAAKAVYGK